MTLSEGVGRSGLGGELDHLLDACGVEVTALIVVPGEEAGLLAAVAAGAVQGPEESGEGHVTPCILRRGLHNGFQVRDPAASECLAVPVEYSVEKELLRVLAAFLGEFYRRPLTASPAEVHEHSEIGIQDFLVMVLVFVVGPAVHFD